MKVLVYSAKPYDRRFFGEANVKTDHTIHFLDSRLSIATVGLASDYEAVCVFVNDTVDEPVIAALSNQGVKGIALRCAGFNNVDLKAAKKYGIRVVRVPAYSPNAVAEHAVALILTLSRNTHRAFNRVRDGNFSLEGLLGFNLHDKTVGLIGVGAIGRQLARILLGFGCQVLAHDPNIDSELESLGVAFVDLDTILRESKIISLHCPLTPDTHHLINEQAIEKMQPGVMLVNTSRGAVVDTRALINGLKQKHIGSVALDVYEEESEFFFEDFSEQVIDDDVLARLLTFPNVLVTGHQGFFTVEALSCIAETTLANLQDIAAERDCENEVLASAD